MRLMGRPHKTPAAADPAANLQTRTCAFCSGERFRDIRAIPLCRDHYIEALEHGAHLETGPFLPLEFRGWGFVRNSLLDTYGLQFRPRQANCDRERQASKTIPDRKD